MLLFLVVCILFLAAILLPKQIKGAYSDYVRSTKSVRMVLFGFAAALLVADCVVVVPPGNMGIPVTLGSVGEPLPLGLHVILPITDVKNISVQVQNYTMDKESNNAILALSRDQLTMEIDESVWYHAEPGQVSNLYKDIGLDYPEIIVKPAIRNAIVNAATEFDATDLMSNKRASFDSVTTTLLNSAFAGKGITLNRVLVRNIYPPSMVSDAIAAKLKADQDAQAMTYQIMYAQKEAQRKAIEAQGIANAQKIINNGLTQQYLQWYYISQLKELVNSPNNTVLILPFDQKLVPLFNIPGKK